jgi:hypothetical protein
LGAHGPRLLQWRALGRTLLPLQWRPSRQRPPQRKQGRLQLQRRPSGQRPPSARHMVLQSWPRLLWSSWVQRVGTRTRALLQMVRSQTHLPVAHCRRQRLAFYNCLRELLGF